MVRLNDNRMSQTNIRYLIIRVKAKVTLSVTQTHRVSEQVEFSAQRRFYTLKMTTMNNSQLSLFTCA